MTTADTLRTARELIANPRHWTTGDLRWKVGDGPTCYCSLGAVGEAVGIFPDTFGVYDADGALIDPTPGFAAYAELENNPQSAPAIKALGAAAQDLAAEAGRTIVKGDGCRVVYRFNDSMSLALSDVDAWYDELDQLTPEAKVAAHKQIMRLFDRAIELAEAQS